MDNIYECITSFQYGIEVGDRKELVRCRDCKHRSDKTYTNGITGEEVYVCQVNDIAKPPSWFCADGERRCDDG